VSLAEPDQQMKMLRHQNVAGSPEIMLMPHRT
jgi:hypothetical protein